MKLELCDDLYLQDVLVFQILGRDVDARRSGTVQFFEHLFFAFFVWAGIKVCKKASKAIFY